MNLAIRIALVILGVAIVVYFAYVLLLAFLFRDFGDHFPPSVIIRNDTTSPVVVFLCDDAATLECRDWGWALNARSTVLMYVTNVVPSGNRFLGEVVAASHDCAVFARARFTSDGSDFAIVVDDHDIEGRNGISPYGERYAPSLSQQGIAPRTTCPDIGGGPGARSMTRLPAEPLLR